MESTIGPESVAGLAPDWAFTLESITDEYGRFENTPVVADGCLYLAATNGWVVALNADTAEKVWQASLPYTGTGYGGAIIGSVAVANGKVYVGVSDYDEPYLAALNQQTGIVEWTRQVDDRPGSFITASPIVYNDVVLVGICGQEASPGSRGGFAVVDANTGDLLKRTYTISEEEFAEGYEGASIWTTPVVDTATGYAYAGTGNPSSALESRYANAIVKIDLDRARTASFGTIVDAYKGNWDGYLPNCNSAARPASCVALDVDFGASLNLFTDGLGRTVVGALQKSGVYYAVFADSMQEAWKAVVGNPGHTFNAASPAADANGVYVPATAPGQMVSLDRTFGSMRWLTPFVDGLHYQPASVANDIVYVTTLEGLLLGLRAADGVPILVRQLAQDTGAFNPAAPLGSGNPLDALSVANTSAGVSIARNTVYVAFQHFVIAYRL
jgi:polyvinyl alcohol dehydrogenase (cytochrome)